MIELPLLEQPLRTRVNSGTTQVWDPVRSRWVALTPEEHVRQLLLGYLIVQMNYPPAWMAVERGITFGHTMLRFDLAVFQKNTAAPWMLAECKAPDVPVTDDALRQLLQYHSKMPACRYWLLTNGHQTLCADAENKHAIKWLTALPAY